jgi:hypothetical protein
MRLASFRFALVGLVLVISSMGASARAEEGPSTDVPVAHQQPETYTLHILAADAVSVGILAASAAIDGASSDDTFANGLAFAGVGGLALGGPIVHAAHGHWGRSAVSLGLRVVLPLVGASIGAATADCQKGEFLCGLSELGLGYTIGQATAITIDAAVLARWSTFEHSPEQRPVRPSEDRAHGVTLVPRVVATPKLGLIGVGGTFF